MAFIREGKHFYGFVLNCGKRYVFDLTISENSSNTQGILKVDWRLKRDLGETLDDFISDNNKLSDPEEFYYQFSAFVQNNLKTSIELWLQQPSRTALLAKSLQQEIGEVGDCIRHFDLKTGIVKIEVIDCQLRIHKAVLQIRQNYKNEAVNVVSHDLPQNKLGIQCNPNLDHIFSVAEFCKRFSELVTCFQNFWNTMSLLESQCCILDPAHPTFKDVFRRIKLKDTMSVVLTFNPFFPTQRPKIKLLGCQSEVNYYQNILQRNLESNIWDDEGDLLFNLSNILELAIPSKISMRESKALDLIETEECAICFTWRLNNEIPNEVCENSNCKSMYHSACLFTYFCSVPRNRDYFGKIQGDCPNCDCTISCAVPKFDLNVKKTVFP